MMQLFFKYEYVLIEEYIGKARHLNPVQGHVLATHVILQFKRNYIFQEKEFSSSSQEYHRWLKSNNSKFKKKLNPNQILCQKRDYN